jgi:hypothetical protein
MQRLNYFSAKAVDILQNGKDNAMLAKWNTIAEIQKQERLLAEK